MPLLSSPPKRMTRAGRAAALQSNTTTDKPAIAKPAKPAQATRTRKATVTAQPDIAEKDDTTSKPARTTKTRAGTKTTATDPATTKPIHATRARAGNITKSTTTEPGAGDKTRAGNTTKSSTAEPAVSKPARTTRTRAGTNTTPTESAATKAVHTTRARAGDKSKPTNITNITKSTSAEPAASKPARTIRARAGTNTTITEPAVSKPSRTTSTRARSNTTTTDPVVSKPVRTTKTRAGINTTKIEPTVSNPVRTTRARAGSNTITIEPAVSKPVRTTRAHVGNETNTTEPAVSKPVRTTRARAGTKNITTEPAASKPVHATRARAGTKTTTTESDNDKENVPMVLKSPPKRPVTSPLKDSSAIDQDVPSVLMSPPKRFITSPLKETSTSTLNVSPVLISPPKRLFMSPLKDSPTVMRELAQPPKRGQLDTSAFLSSAIKPKSPLKASLLQAPPQRLRSPLKVLDPRTSLSSRRSSRRSSLLSMNASPWKVTYFDDEMAVRDLERMVEGSPRDKQSQDEAKVNEHMVEGSPQDKQSQNNIQSQDVAKVNEPMVIEPEHGAKNTAVISHKRKRSLSISPSPLNELMAIETEHSAEDTDVFPHKRKRSLTTSPSPLIEPIVEASPQNKQSQEIIQSQDVAKVNEPRVIEPEHGAKNTAVISRKRKRSLSVGPSPLRKFPRLYSPTKNDDETLTNFLASAASSPAKTPKPSSIPSGPLYGAVVLVDVCTEEGADANTVFVDLLTAMGARCVDMWTYGITHVVYKDGSKKTLENIREAGFIHCVGVGWVLDCEREQKWLNERDYAVDVSAVPLSLGRRNRSMESKAATPNQKITGWGIGAESPMDTTMIDAPPLEATPAPSPAKLAEPETPFVGQAPTPSQQTCPPKVGAQELFASEANDAALRGRLELLRRKSLRYLPRVSSPLRK